MSTLLKFCFLFFFFTINTEFLFSQGRWVQTNGPSGGTSQFGTANQLLISRTGNIFSIGNNFSLTTDEGKNWTDLQAPDSFLYHGPFTLDSSDAIILFSRNTVYRSTNN